jgi:hypothetical protein
MILLLNRLSVLFSVANLRRACVKKSDKYAIFCYSIISNPFYSKQNPNSQLILQTCNYGMNYSRSGVQIGL